jgi:hypothetical protein
MSVGIHVLTRPMYHRLTMTILGLFLIILSISTSTTTMTSPFTSAITTSITLVALMRLMHRAISNSHTSRNPHTTHNLMLPPMWFVQYIPRICHLQFKLRHWYTVAIWRMTRASHLKIRCTYSVILVQHLFLVILAMASARFPTPPSRPQTGSKRMKPNCFQWYPCNQLR